MAAPDRFISRITRLKLALAAGGRANRALVPVVEAIEVLYTHGPREVAARVRTRVASKPIRPPAGFRPPVDTDVPLILPALGATRSVSIVIPVLDQLALTHHCLSAIIEHTPPGVYEVIVVDNGSSEPTRRMLDQVAGLRVIRNTTNTGFVEACNQGARAARCEFVLFLNNDTAVLPGWLDALIKTVTSHASIGAVGAKLLYPDGRLQESGSIIWNDGSAWNYGKSGDPAAPEFNFVRDVDYCSGACLLVPRKLFEALGGFDERFAPAYYEDVDLCFRLREQGYRVVYQPTAEIVHREGSTAGTDTRSGFKRYQRVNQKKFVERHSAALERQHAPDPRSLRSACDRRTGRRILIVDHMVPHFDEDAGSVRMLAILRALSELNYRVTFFPDNLARIEPYSGIIQQLGIEVIYGPAGQQFIEKHVEEFSMVVLSRAYFAAKHLQPITSRRRRPYLIFDTVDLHHLREARRATLEPDEATRKQAEQTKAVELEVMRACDMVWVTSTHELDLLRSYNANLLVELVPAVYDVRSIAPSFHERKDVLFIGGFRHPPNEDAVLSFAGQIWPLVKGQLPGARFVIVGSHMTPRVSSLAAEDIIVMGHVADVTPLFDGCRLSVAPIRYGAGVNGKVIQSMAWGLPVVASPLGVEGLGLKNHEQVIVASEPDEFARSIVTLYSNQQLWEQLADAGRRYVNAHLSSLSLKDRLESLLARIGRSN